MAIKFKAHYTTKFLLGIQFTRHTYSGGRGDIINLFQTKMVAGISIDHDGIVFVKLCLGSAPPDFGSSCPVVADAAGDDSGITTGGVGSELKQA